MTIFFRDSTPGAEEEYQIRLRGDGRFLWFIDQTHGNRVDMTIDTITGNVGFGIPIGVGNFPTEQVDVDGNLRVRGDIISEGNIVPTGDICIGNCP